MAIQPVPPLVLASEFPTNADRTAGVWNAKAAAWAGSENAMATSVRDIAAVTQNNATEATTASAAAVPAAAQAVAARDQAVPAAAQAVAARDQAVPAAAQALAAAQRAEDAAASIEDGPVTSVNGKTGVVHLGMTDVAPGSVVAYGPDKASARAAIDAGLDYSRGQQTFSASQTISKTMFGTATWVLVELWAGGQSGRWMINTSGSSPAAGGEGGDYMWAILRIADITDGAQLIVGAGGARITSPASGINNGGDSSFMGLIAYGGGNANNARNIGRSGGEAGNVEGSGIANQKTNAANGGAGGGAAGIGTRSPAGVSVRGGNGGAELVTTVSGSIGNDGAAPGGGGGGAWLNAASGVITSGGGGAGRAVFTWW